VRFLRSIILAFLLLPFVAANAQRSYDVDILAETFGFDAATKKSVALADLRQGCPVRDCIPSIDGPKFVSAEEATHVGDDELVITLSYKGEYRAYPSKILDHHEIVNDTIAGDPLAITWCPLCGSAVGIERTVGGEITEFGVSGVLYNSDLVLYDRATETLWDQIEATGVVGTMTGVELTLVPVSMSRWAKWRGKHPDTLVLSADTGFEYDYTQDRFAEYRDSTRLFMPVSASDDRVHAKTVVFGFDLPSGAVAYAESVLPVDGSYSHDLNGAEAVVTLHDDGKVTMQRDDQTYHPIRVFWFAWYTFHPETDLLH
jgi:Protein of unknown function (DUF3179)